MPLYMENYGLGFLTEDEKTVCGLAAHIAEKGKAITGYYGLPYFNLHLGDVQMILRTRRRDEDQALEVTGMDSHAAGRTVWEVLLSGASFDRDDADKLEKRVVVSNADGSGGMAVINIVNADVLPSFAEDDILRLQVLAFPELISYYADEDEYENDQPDFRKGRKFLLEEGTVLPSGLLRNRNPDAPDFGEHPHLDDINNIRGTVKSLEWGSFTTEEDTYNPYIVCTIDTQFGPLEILHAPEQVDEAQRENIRVGAIVVLYGTLSADAAIDEYENGIVRDEEHDLAALRYVFSGGDPERLRAILTEDAVYYAAYNETSYFGPDAIIERLGYVQKNHEGTYIAQKATVTEAGTSDAPTDYPAGKRCIVLSNDRETNYETIVFLDVDDAGNITRLTTSVDPRYRFRTDEKPQRRSVFDNMKLPDSVMEPILLRARFLGVTDDSMTDEAILGDNSSEREHQNNIRNMLEQLPFTEGQEAEKRTENLFGYLFAKAAEMRRPGISGFFCTYSPTDAWEGCIHGGVNEDEQAALEEAMELGKQFYRDYSFYRQCNPDKNDEDDLTAALLLVQKLGGLYAKECFGTQTQDEKE